MAIYKIRKRNWSIVSFDRDKIEKAIKLAIQSVGGEDFSRIPWIVDRISQEAEAASGNNIPDVELIQDMVEKVLIKEGHDTVAKAYIIYRQKRAESRASKKIVVEVGQTMDEYLNQTDWRVNANSNQGYSLGW